MWSSRSSVARESWPWIDEKKDKLALVISTVKVPTFLISLKVSFGDDPEPYKTKVQVAFTWTDHRVNEADDYEVPLQCVGGAGCVSEDKIRKGTAPVDCADGQSGSTRVGTWRHEELQSGARVRHRCPTHDLVRFA